MSAMAAPDVRQKAWEAAYRERKRLGIPARPPVMDRWWANVDTSGGPDECWPWTGWIHPVSGYGRFYANGRPNPAHRFGYEAIVGPIPEGMEPDHLCRNKACVNHRHLEPVTHQVNCQRGHRRPVVACVRGHLSAIHRTPNGQCRPCRREDMVRCRARRTAA